MYHNIIKRVVANVDLPGGLADGMSDSKYDEEQLADGIKVELEHTDDVEIAKDIAKDHLEEFSNYYDGLEEMEKKLEEKKNNACLHSNNIIAAVMAKINNTEKKSKIVEPYQMDRIVLNFIENGDPVLNRILKNRATTLILNTFDNIENESRQLTEAFVVRHFDNFSAKEIVQLLKSGRFNYWREHVITDKKFVKRINDILF